MKRRDFLATALPLPFLGWIPRSQPQFGWLPGYHSSKQSFGQVAHHLDRFGSGKVACLWKPYQTVTGKSWEAHKQQGPDCVAQAAGGGMDLLTAVQIILKQSKEQWITKSNTDMIYAGGRKIIGENKLGRSGGMPGEWAVKYLKQYGNLLRQQYDDFNLTTYSKNTMRKWDNQGVPTELLTIAKEHPLLEYAPVKSWYEFRDAIAAGYPVLWCASFYGGYSRRDEDGFIKTSNRMKWYHAWLGAGVDDGERPGACLLNSHGSNYGSGPKRHGQPDGSVWVDARHIDKHCRNFGDSYALSLYKGFPKPEEDYILW